MTSKLHDELRPYFEKGQQITFPRIEDAMNHGGEIIDSYVANKIERKSSSILKYVRVHQENYLKLAQLILELRGWLSTHQENTYTRQLVEIRVQNLIAFISGLNTTTQNISQGWAEKLGLHEDANHSLEKAKTLANQILHEVEQVQCIAVEEPFK